MKTILAVVVLMVAGVASADDCVVCSPGTTPFRYKATFNSGAAPFVLTQSGNCTWVNAGRQATFMHSGTGANQSGGLFAVPQASFTFVSIDASYNTGGRISTTNIRDGNGPFVITIYDRYGNALDMVTLVPF